MAGSAAAQTICSADFSLLGQGQVSVEIRPRPDGRFDALVNGRVTNESTVAVEEDIRPHLNLAADPYGKEIAQFNAAERSLVHLHKLRESSQTRDLIKIPFAPADVRRMKTFDLIGKMDKFGGQVLLEAFDEGGRSLGKVLRRGLAGTCR